MASIPQEPAKRKRTALGAVPASGGTGFRVWAPQANRVEVLIEHGPTLALTAALDGYHQGHLPGVGAGALYRYRVDGAGPFPDPASRHQPLGVFGPSAVVDPASFHWTDDDWSGPELADMAIYELHVGTFTPEGTFAAAEERLGHLVDLGANALQIMPVADFPGLRNWGYDGVALYAPARCYGTPDDLRRLVDAAHRRDLAVILDVVYNHLGPDGNYLGTFNSRHFTPRHHTPWGDAVNYDGEGSEGVRAFVVENALHWICEYHADGLRLDATHAIFDDGPRHILAEIAEHARAATERRVVVIAEDERNLSRVVQAEANGGYGLDAVFADDFHHQVRRRLAGDRDGYYADFTGATADLARTLRDGWLYQGQRSPHLGRPRGTEPRGIPLERFIYCVQNHDQIGNRAFGDRLHQQIDPAAWRAAVALLLLSPETPLLFMGQEWAATTPFLYFTDHGEKLGRLVTAGRRREFSRFDAFSDPNARERIPDPQAVATFEASRLSWAEAESEPHASVLRLHRSLLRLRRKEIPSRRRRFEASQAGDSALVLSYGDLVAVVQLEGEGRVDLAPFANRVEQVTFSTEETGFAPDSNPALVEPNEPSVRFHRPGAVVLRVSLARKDDQCSA